MQDLVVAVPIEDQAGECTYTKARDTAAFYASSGGADRILLFLSDELIP